MIMIICIFLYIDDITLHFTLSGSSDITGYFLVYLQSGGRFELKFKLGSKIEFELEGFFEVFFKRMVRFPLIT